MDPTFVDILTASTDEDARAQAQAMAQQMRRQKLEGLMGMAGGRRSQMIGKELGQDADMAEKGLLSAGINRLHYGQQAQELKQRGIDAADMRALEVQRLRNLAAMGHDSTALEIAKLKALAGANKPGKTLTSGEVTKMIDADTLLGRVSDLKGAFKPSYAGKGPLGNVVTRGEGILGSWGTKGMQEEGNWWADYRKYIENIQRHEMFGSAFTQTEQRAWEAANRIRPGASPATVQAALGDLESAMKRHLAKHATGRIKEGFNGEAIRSYAGNAMGGSTPGNHLGTYNPATGEFE